jgi:DNA modification methylase
MEPWAKIITGDSRNMVEVDNEAVDLIITSPPYWQIKDYGESNQVGYNQSLHDYLKDLFRVWSEAFRILRAGRRLCINIGDQFARSIIYGRYKIIPLHSEVISQCEELGFDFMGSIIWQKKTTMNTTGGATIMGSFPYPPNGMVEIDYEHILIFKKPGDSVKIDKSIKEKSEITKEEWKEYFSGHWYFGGARQVEHEAMFPDELPHRLIKMFSFYNEVVLDPFLGSGTTAKAAINLGRNAIGYEINESFKNIIKSKLETDSADLFKSDNVTFVKQQGPIEKHAITYQPRIQDANCKIEPGLLKFKEQRLYRVVSLAEPDTLQLDTGLRAKLLGITLRQDKTDSISDYMNKYVLKKEVFLRLDKDAVLNKSSVQAYIYLKNKIFINAYLLKAGLAVVDAAAKFDQKEKFMKLSSK